MMSIYARHLHACGPAPAARGLSLPQLCRWRRPNLLQLPKQTPASPAFKITFFGGKSAELMEKSTDQTNRVLPEWSKLVMSTASYGLRRLDLCRRWHQCGYSRRYQVGRQDDTNRYSESPH
jgi:hypothetical protein